MSRALSAGCDVALPRASPALKAANCVLDLEDSRSELGCRRERGADTISG